MKSWISSNDRVIPHWWRKIESFGLIMPLNNVKPMIQCRNENDYIGKMKQLAIFRQLLIQEFEQMDERKDNLGDNHNNNNTKHKPNIHNAGNAGA